jgi:hypothetical protein
LKYGDLYPFVETQEECELSIFHPFVYPAYRSPLDVEEPVGESTYNWHTVNDTVKEIHRSEKNSEPNDILERSLHDSKGSTKLRKKKTKRDS